MGIVEVSVGDLVRVTGYIELYRGSMEIIPTTYTSDHLQVIVDGGHEPVPLDATVQDATRDEALLGSLIAVEGRATRIAEYSYSYEVDLADDDGNSVLLYIDKLTEATTEPLDVGKRYRVTGISELYDTTWQLKPRFQIDLVELFPPELMLEMRAANSVLPGELLTYTLTALNHTDEPLSNVRITAVPPAASASVVQILDGGERADGALVWTIRKLSGGGKAATVRYIVAVTDGAGGQIVAEPAEAVAEEWPGPVVAPERLTFVGSGVPIWAIQGGGMTSPYARDRATTVGVVTGVFPDMQGFWIQEVETDEDPSTSSGLFVQSGELEAPVELGDEIRLSGKVRERSGQTLLELLSLDELSVLSSGNELPAAVELDPPSDEGAAQLYFEALEGMLVQLSEPTVAVGPTSKYGETPLVKAKWGIQRVLKGDAEGMLIFVDDGSAATHYSLDTLPFAVQTGDSLSGVVGPLAYTFEQYKIEPITTPTIGQATRTWPTARPAGVNEFSIATFNAENLFDYFAPNPSDFPMPSRSQYGLDLAKMADSIVTLGAPVILGLQEVENIGVLVDLVQQPAITEYAYQPFLFEGTDSRGIDVAFLVRDDIATIEGAAPFPAPEGLTSRPPLLITVTLHLDAGDTTVYVLNNHFTSMSGGEIPTEPRRKAQAAWNVSLVDRILSGDPEAFVVVLGDLNSFYDAPPIDVLRDGGLRHVYEFLEPERPYAYIYQGVSENLDHILVTPAMYQHLVRVEVLHINADYPPPVPGDPSARRASDHDPLIATFAIP
jgi:predicted extracellular nuclease